jgi:hypothetical protein
MKALMTLVLMLVLAECAAGRGDGGSTVAEEETTARHAEETTALQEGRNLNRPPDSTLSYGGREVTGKLGSYCWFSRASGVCADMVYPVVPPKQQRLTVPSGSEMVFHYGGQRSPKTMEATASPLGKKEGGSRRSLKAQGSRVKRIIPAELPPGEYVVEVLVKEQQGDVPYYFRVTVQ